MDIMKKNPKGGRPPKSASEKLKERLTVKMAAADYYLSLIHISEPTRP